MTARFEHTPHEIAVLRMQHAAGIPLEARIIPIGSWIQLNNETISTLLRHPQDWEFRKAHTNAST